MTSPRLELSELQLAVMQALWQAGEASTAEVQQAMAARELAYTTVATLLDRLAERGLLSVSRDGREKRFRPTVDEATVRRSMVGGLLSRLFGGDPGALVAHLVEERELDAEELGRLRRLLADHRAGEGRGD